MSTKDTAISIMFEEMKERLEKLETQLTTSIKDTEKQGYDFKDVKTIINSIITPSVEGIENELTELHSAFNKNTAKIQAMVQKKEEDKIVSHIHSIEFKSTKVCIALVVLSLTLCLSLFFNFR